MWTGTISTNSRNNNYILLRIFRYNWTMNIYYNNYYTWVMCCISIYSKVFVLCITIDTPLLLNYVDYVCLGTINPCWSRKEILWGWSSHHHTVVVIRSVVFVFVFVFVFVLYVLAENDQSMLRSQTETLWVNLTSPWHLYLQRNLHFLSSNSHFRLDSCVKLFRSARTILYFIVCIIYEVI